MTALGSWFGVGSTFGATGSRSAIDHVLAPIGLLSRVRRVAPLRRSMRWLQATPSSAPRDHCPVGIWVDLRVRHATAPRGPPPDRDALMEGSRRGMGRRDFLATL